MSKHFETLLKLAVIVILVVAATTSQHYNYYVFLHWSVFITSIYFAFKSRNDGYPAIIFFIAAAVLFNPIKEFLFHKETWTIIDFVISALLLLTIDWKGNRESLSPREKLVYELVKQCIYGALALVAAFCIISYLFAVNPYHEYLLITKSKIADGFITKVDEYEDDVVVPDSQGGGSEEAFTDNYHYTFTTADGKIFNDQSSDIGYMKDFNNEPLSIKVEYLPSNPKINRVKDETNQCKTIGEFIWRRLVFGFLLLIGILVIEIEITGKAIKKYLAEDKKLNASA